MRGKTGGNRLRWIWGICLVLLWTCAALLFIKLNGHMSVEELLRYQPKSKLAAALAMCALFLLKSVDFLLHSGVLYAIDGILFPMLAAFALNTLGNAIMSAIPWFIGRSLGGPLLKRIEDRYPRFREFAHTQARGTVFFTFLFRCLGLPIPIVGLYMGASCCSFWKYMLGSVLGLTPLTIPYTLLGEGVGDKRSPIFIIAVATEILLCALALMIGRRLRKKEQEQGDCGDGSSDSSEAR